MTGSDVFVHPQGLCESTQVGEGSRVWAFAHVLGGARIGRNANICDHVFIENDVVVGDDVTIKCGVQLWDGVRVGDGVFIGPNATFTNDRFPRSKHYPDAFLPTTLEDGVSIGANATILPGLHIGMGAMVGAGAVVTRNVPPNAIVAGNPAAIIGYRQEPGAAPQGTTDAGNSLSPQAGVRQELGVRGCWIERLPNFGDMRGSLTALEEQKGLPFLPARVFLVHGVPNDRVRGEHAHRRCRQFLVAASGAVSVMVDDGTTRREVRLDTPAIGLHLAPMVWGTQYKFSRDCVLMVAASDRYDDADYIRHYAEFRSLAASRT